ncbi:hypothetical protein PHYBLDRAFT_62991 [Phycomyces blakesleeanus NRRL 1555(-)]|uniref:F-box domain-containing protein n=1 Tax=Phycomyces blakesleeanus (strain ATCC 8743b / DSM 1359 / FGSC 10004 / NBRC 33097 / NRRL 1555) TaxID=763407 RepID=A0A162UKK8_PHYB8|nr:hypothetical protein PHYBLDRAFT_62991 [Phycomyces blakesleeanus NRRL 1555(-)]OAD76812.1 hypothetical protein PHYBLDRAFT_62991 [Phycomyces blakesleeanus NRRL 1555(-)]|eukprot:XP_018294852.1 hypothetical protein PHYBLDRAFT_62991 [Phycomyces blakesleeanus NRRL 1555(-)]
MLASELPFEILHKIGMFLCQSDLVKCTMVSKTWKQPFLEALWRFRLIIKPSTLDAILDTTSKENIYTKYGRHTRELGFAGPIVLKQGSIFIIQQRFQNLKALNLLMLDGQIIDLGGLADWDLWSTLTYLTINANLLNPVSGKDEIINAFKCLPKLESLIVQQDEWRKVLEFSLTDFENLHTFLPCVRTLKLDASLAELTNADAELLTHVTPALDLSFASVCFGAKDLRWLYYFAQKYPNVRILDCKSSDQYITQYTHQTETASMLSKLPSVFPHVKKAEFWSPSNSDDLLIILCGLLHPFNVPISHLKYRFRHRLREVVSPDEKIQQCTRLLPKTLTTLCIINQQNTRLSRFNTTALRYCPNLVYLSISDRDAFISFDLLLDFCQHLKIFKLDQGLLLLSTETSFDSPNHGLEAIDISRASISVPTFEYTSIRCELLECMRLNDVKIVGAIEKRTGSFCISMAFTSFRLLHLNKVQFYPTDYITVNKPIHLVVLSRYTTVTQNNHHPKRHTHLREDYYPREVFEYMWHHTYCNDRSDYDRLPQTRMLTRKETKIARRYFRSSRRNKHIGEDDSADRSIEGHVQENEWEKDLHRGYVSFFCQYIHKYEFGGNMMYSLDIKTMIQYSIYSHLSKVRFYRKGFNITSTDIQTFKYTEYDTEYLLILNIRYINLEEIYLKP